MLRVADIQPILQRAANNGTIRSTMLVSSDGRLLASVCSDEDSPSEEALAAVAASAYQEYSSAAAGNFDSAGLVFLVLSCEGRDVALTSIDDRFLLVACTNGGGPPAGITVLRKQVLALKDEIKPHVNKVGSYQALLSELTGSGR